MGADKNERSKNKPKGDLFHNGKLDTTGTAFDWGSVDPGRLLEIVEFVTVRGGAIRIGYSRDGNAGSVGIYYGDERGTLYIRPNEDVETTYQLIESTLRDKPVTGGKSPDA